MPNVLDVNWTALFSFSISPLEIIVRGTMVYLFLFVVFRFALRRDIGAVGVADLLLLVIVADASQNAMAGGSETVSDGLLLVATLIGWNVAFDWLAYRFSAFRRFAEPRPLCLIKDGRILERKMRREYLTRDELMTKLREQGVESLAEVKAAYLESDGQFSIIKKKH